MRGCVCVCVGARAPAHARWRLDAPRPCETQTSGVTCASGAPGGSTPHVRAQRGRAPSLLPGGAATRPQDARRRMRGVRRGGARRLERGRRRPVRDGALRRRRDGGTRRIRRARRCHAMLLVSHCAVIAAIVSIRCERRISVVTLGRSTRLSHRTVRISPYPFAFAGTEANFFVASEYKIYQFFCYLRQEAGPAMEAGDQGAKSESKLYERLKLLQIRTRVRSRQ